MSVCKRCTENGNCAWQNHDETICREKPAFPITNADRIRSMSEEELAEWLCDIAGWLPMYEGKMHPILDWIKEEAASDG